MKNAPLPDSDSTENPHISRRSFVAALAGGAAVAAGATAHAIGWVDSPEVSLKEIIQGKKGKLVGRFGEVKLTDQYGKDFDPAMLDGQKYLTVFGFNGCLACQNIGKNLAKIQADLLGRGRTVPIVSISSKPEEDMGNMRDYVQNLRNIGIREFKGNTPPAQPETVPAKDRLLTILCVQTKDKSGQWKPNTEAMKQLHFDLGMFANMSVRGGHSPNVTVFDERGNSIASHPAHLRENNPRVEMLITDIRKAVEGTRGMAR